MFFDKIYESWREIQYEKFSKIFGILQGLEGKTVLDVGCGDMFLEEFLKSKGINAHIISVDVKMPNHIYGKFVLADGNFLPFKNVFDAVIVFDSGHLFNLERVKDVVVENGEIIVATPEKFSHRVKLDLPIKFSTVLNGKEKEIVTVYILSGTPIPRR